MQWGLASVGVGVIHVCALLDQEFAQAPVAVKAGAIQPKIFSKGRKRRATQEQVLDRAHVAVIRTVRDKREAFMNGDGGSTVCQILKDRVGATGRDFGEARHSLAS